eukprot:scaffold129016_cov22-Prasinocladus_malaysianus.AAC.1
MGMGYNAQPVTTVEMLKCTAMLSAHADIILSVAYAASSPVLHSILVQEWSIHYASKLSSPTV